MKKRVRILTSIAGLGDPRPKAELDAKYAAVTAKLKNQERPPAQRAIDDHIADLKKADRYGDPPIGFTMDWSFKPGDEPSLPERLAEKWESAGICVGIADIADTKKVA